MFDVVHMLNELTVKDIPINQLLNIQACSFIVEQGLYPISSGKLQVLSSSPDIH